MAKTISSAKNGESRQDAKAEQSRALDAKPPKWDPAASSVDPDDEDEDDEDEDEDEELQQKVEDRVEKQTAIRDYMRKKGYSGLDELDDDQILEELEGVASRANKLPSDEEYSRMQQLARVGQEVETDLDAFKRWKAEQQAKIDADKKPEAPEKKKWEALQWNQDWDGRVKYDEAAQRYVPKTTYDSPAVAEEVNRFFDRQKKITRQLAADPLALVREAGLDDYVESLLAAREKQIEERIMSKFSGTRQSDQIEKYLDSRRESLFELDAKGQPKQGNDGPVLTEAGRAYRDGVKTAREEFGIEDQAKVHAFAKREAERVIASQESKGNKGGKKAAAAPATGADKRKTFLQRANEKGADLSRFTNRNGTVSAAAKRQDAQNDASDWHGLIKQTEAELQT